MSLLPRGRLISLAAMTAMASLSCLTVANADEPQVHIDFRLAKRQIQHFTAMTCAHDAAIGPMTATGTHPVVCLAIRGRSPGPKVSSIRRTNSS